MAAGTPTVYAPANSTSGIRMDDVLYLLKSPYSGAGTQREVRWQISLTNSFPASGSNLIFDTLLRENDDRWIGDDWAECFVPLYLFTPNTTYYVSCMVRNTSNESSSWATATSFATTALTDMTAATWTGAR